MHTAIASPKKARSVVSILDRFSLRAAADLALAQFGTPRPRASLPHEESALWMADQQWIERDGLQLAAWIWEPTTPDLREPVAGPTILLAHGWGGSAAQMAPLAATLSNQGFRVVAFDAPAHGRSPGARAHLLLFARAIRSMADTFGPLAVVAHSMGGAAAVIAHAEKPIAAKLALLAPPHNVEARIASFLRVMGYSADVGALMRGRLEEMFGRSLESLRSVPLVKGLQTPALIVHDEGDREIPFREGAELAQAWPGAELLTTVGLGHNRILTAETVVRRLVTFLSQKTVI